MDVRALQQRLVDAGKPVAVDGVFGPKSRAALREALTGPTDRVTPAQIASAASVHGLTPELVGAVYDVESRGQGMSPATGLPIILFEPHVFSRLTGRKFDASHPDISYRVWKTRPYPATQTGRWDQLLAACALDPDAAMQSASWGLGQIMGFNHAACGDADVWTFARSMARGEGEQLAAMLTFIDSKGLTAALKRKDWRSFARAYNGDGQVDKYAGLLANAYAKRGGK